ncbi:ubiquitin-activating enzyme [Phycomyces blakesleeanus]|uniref:Ubiquitin-activating enzyme E1-like n=1 Tax=Phycomyces blakesleeanus TaxID=4837 RepID=A0ABR3AUT4_PHYBL
MPRDSHLKKILGSSTYNTVASSNVLLIGAGGIGCEVLKNLVLMGFKNISVVDLDTIEISNLNRQFLFQKEHVGQPKAHVAREAVLKFQPKANITSHHANIKDSQFGIEWFKQFSFVLNALDNLDARYYVNKMCLAAEIPLVESGTSGYKGQSYIIKKGVTECFSCSPKPTPTTYPVCTIRSTPNAPIHCIVWAKNFLFCQLFGDAELSDAIKEDASDDNEELSELKREANDLKEIKNAMGTEEYTRLVFTKVFTTDIQRLLDANISRGGRKPPCPLDYETLDKQAKDPKQTVENEDGQETLADRKVWSLPECFHVFKESANNLALQLIAQQANDPNAMLSFDKDDDVAMDFVTSASNLRAYVFDIEQKCLFDVKSMAGNIIPAIATTNAIIGGEVVMNAYRILNNKIEKSKRNYVDTQVANGSAFMNEEISKPNPECDVCKSKNVPIQVSKESATLGDIIDSIILKPVEDGGVGFDEEFLIMDGNKLIYDPDYDDNKNLLLKELGIQDSSILRVSPDEGQPLDLIVQFIDPLSDDKDIVARITPKDIPTKEKLVSRHKRSLEDVEMEEKERPMKKRATSEDMDVSDNLAREFWASLAADKAQAASSISESQQTNTSISGGPSGSYEMSNHLG